ncbi:apolipoprotein N-acyltransferase [Nocardioides flavus (ex Wang et al. 2016)]|uniref:Apolipoprotein N-acyltransferase n=1 Tax=Nocardioides flavus (ex Wang et al. 2016) TaxID=2058780 RepID=A0ABQ3HSP6_9ACTN|nr:apolipoprotein N-acyltransferase [Nocardioides flavus (ex Wang et al. 2016)]GHE19169.1 apolipoprotein N-acyltransferase [Nocardioides flavus (ex Wang et al. 2016)]
MSGAEPGRTAVRPLLALGSGALLAGAYQPVDLPALSIPAVAVFSAVAWSGTWRAGALAGAAFGLGFLGPLLWWLSGSISPGAWLALVAVQAGWFALLGSAIATVRSLPGVAWWTAVLWTAVEVLRSAWPLGGLPWGRLGFSALDTVWQGWLQWGGVTITTFVLALVGAATGRLVVSRGPRAAPLGVAGLVAAASMAPATMAAKQPRTDDNARVAIVQGGVPGAGNRLVDYHREVTDNHARETLALFARRDASGQPAPDFVLWPENATAVDPVTDERANRAIRETARATGVPLLAGSVTDGPGADGARNQGIVWSSSGAPGQRYTKRHLVPFGEYVPWRSLATRFSNRLTEIPRDMVAGTVGAPLDVAGIPVADALCFDVAYDDVIAPQVRRGASLVTVQTSNAMFLGTTQLEQQWDISRVRAIESGRAVVVASVNGVSGAIGPDGKVIARLAIRGTASAVVEVPLARTFTPAVRWGPWPGRAAVALAFVGLAGGAARRLRSTTYDSR